MWAALYASVVSAKTHSDVEPIRALDSNIYLFDQSCLEILYSFLLSNVSNFDS